MDVLWWMYSSLCFAVTIVVLSYVLAYVIVRRPTICSGVDNS